MIYDWALSKDGDLVLGDPEVNQAGETLYEHMDATIDTEMGDDGREIRDIGYVWDLEAEKQVILNRLRTDSPDWYHHPQMGGNLTDLIGEPNTRKTAEKGVASILAALTYRNLYTATQIHIRPVPVNENEVLFLITISKFGSREFRLPLVFDLSKGLLDVYEVPKRPEESLTEPPSEEPPPMEPIEP